MRARIDISEVESRTKIRAKYLRAIENEEWDLLPGPVYVKSFLKTYGDYLGLDSRLLIDEFKRRYERPSDHELRPMASLARDRERAKKGPVIPPWAVIAGVLVVIVGLLYWLGAGSSNPSKPSPTSAKASVHHGHTQRGHHHAVHKKTTARVRHRSVKLQLVPTGPVYVCVADRAGKVLIPGQTFSLGSTIPVEKSDELFVILGNNSVDVKANGKSYPVTASASAIDLKVTSAGVTTLAAGKAPSCA
jgi:helix-turn-helix protein